MSYSNSPPDHYQHQYVDYSSHRCHYSTDGEIVSDCSDENYWSCNDKNIDNKPVINLPDGTTFNHLPFHPVHKGAPQGICSSPVNVYMHQYRTACAAMMPEMDDGSSMTVGSTYSVVPVVKKRSTANKKERRRTQSINNAYADLRDCIPNVPADTKLSKIKTLRLATSYISYLTRALEGNDLAGSFKAELGNMHNNVRKSSSVSSLQVSGMNTNESSTSPTHVEFDPLADDTNHTIQDPRAARHYLLHYVGLWISFMCFQRLCTC
ncbi:unnamed protein product [Acanthoscelides obtectus]|uniref:BHLH domain-containing protein n=1 Tax=Acanthoscelides obtectus TaxID=200917 RepID=A0A9P0PHB1_ACAOB|nr:unnamed protein product [Acanthoscelides obtectus]CAK1677981.1 Heart- and neural crest derivatives-expressed protein 2 [Acanthoscelides obtectus]